MQTYADNLLTKQKGTTDNALGTFRSTLRDVVAKQKPNHRYWGPVKPCSIKEARNAATKRRKLVEHAEMEPADLDLLKRIKATTFDGSVRMPWYVSGSHARKQCTGSQNQEKTLTQFYH